MSKDVVGKRSNKGGCWAFFSCSKKNDNIPDMPINTSVKLDNKSKLKGPLGIQKSINMSIDIKKLSGFTIGTNSETFDRVKKINEQIRDDVEAWKYISFFTKDHVTYDFRCSVREQAIALIVAVSDIAKDENPDFFGVTSRRLITRIMIKKKLQRIAEQKGLTVPQMFIQNIYNLVSNDVELFPEKEIRQKKEKFMQLKKIYKACKTVGSTN